MIESLVIVIFMLAIVFFILALYDERYYHKIMCSSVSMLLWIILWAAFLDIEVIGRTNHYLDYGLSYMAMGFVIINIVQVIYGLMSAYLNYKKETELEHLPPHLRRH